MDYNKNTYVPKEISVKFVQQGAIYVPDISYVSTQKGKLPLKLSINPNAFQGAS